MKIIKKIRPKRKRPYVKVIYSSGSPVRVVVSRSEIPEERYNPTKNGEKAIYFVGPFRTNAGAELFKYNPGVYINVAAAEKAVVRNLLEGK